MPQPRGGVGGVSSHVTQITAPSSKHLGEARAQEGP